MIGQEPLQGTLGHDCTIMLPQHARLVLTCPLPKDCRHVSPPSHVSLGGRGNDKLFPFLNLLALSLIVYRIGFT